MLVELSLENDASLLYFTALRLREEIVCAAGLAARDIELILSPSTPLIVGRTLAIHSLTHTESKKCEG